MGLSDKTRFLSSEWAKTYFGYRRALISGQISQIVSLPAGTSDLSRISSDNKIVPHCECVELPERSGLAILASDG